MGDSAKNRCLWLILQGIALKDEIWYDRDAGIRGPAGSADLSGRLGPDCGESPGRLKIL